jgi:hypothetical protein
VIQFVAADRNQRDEGKSEKLPTTAAIRKRPADLGGRCFHGEPPHAAHVKECRDVPLFAFTVKKNG